MNRFVVLLWYRNDIHNRHYVIANSLTEAREKASDYEANDWVAEVIPYTIDLRHKV